jgi:hypothetical protein
MDKVWERPSQKNTIITSKHIFALFITIIFILIYHIYFGLSSIVVFPAYLGLLLLLSFIVNNQQIYFNNGKTRIHVDTTLTCMIIGLSILALLSYALTPLYIADHLPDANYIDQLLKIYAEHGKIFNGAGTNEAYYYSFYPFFESLGLAFCEISAIPSTVMLRVFPIINILLLIITWVSIYKTLLGRAGAYLAILIALTSFHLIVVFIRPLHPSFALIFTSIVFMIWGIELRSKSVYLSNMIIIFLCVLAIVLSHNTTALLLAILLIIVIIMSVLGRLLSLKITFPISHGKFTYFIVLLIIVYFAYNTYVATFFFETGTLRALINYIDIALSREDFFPSVVYGIKINIVGGNELTINIYEAKKYIGYVSLLVYLLASAIVLLRRFVSYPKTTRKDERNGIYGTFISLSLASALIILVGLLTWSQTYARDYYWRFYSYYFLFSSPVLVNYLLGSHFFKKKIKSILIFMLILNSILWLPNISLGTDMPYEFSDPRAGALQAIHLSTYLHERYEQYYISGSNYIFNVIGPLSNKIVHSLVSSDAGFFTAPKDMPIVISNIEASMINLNEHYKYEGILIYDSGLFSVIIKA